MTTRLLAEQSMHRVAPGKNPIGRVARAAAFIGALPLLSLPITAQAVKDTNMIVDSIPPAAVKSASLATVIALENPTLVKAGDTVASYRVLYSDSSGIQSYFHSGWLVKEVGRTGIGLVPFISLNELLGERVLLDSQKIAERVNYGGSRTISMGAGDSLVGGPLTVWTAKNHNGVAVVATKFAKPQGVRVPYSIQREIVNIGSEVDRFGKVTAITDRGVEFTQAVMPWDPGEDALRAASRSKDGGTYVPAWQHPRTRFVRFGEVYTVGHYCNSTTVIPTWGASGYTAAFIKIIREGEQKK
ncbi:MAG: hypothetical protein PHV13_05835 [Candidatus ainarchaeum sp.]|nr:hypothetical protein [Candidatus ainarchaeum sp.]